MTTSAKILYMVTDFVHRLICRLNDLIQTHRVWSHDQRWENKTYDRKKSRNDIKGSTVKPATTFKDSRAPRTETGAPLDRVPQSFLAIVYPKTFQSSTDDLLLICPRRDPQT